MSAKPSKTTIYDIAERSGYSSATVSRALANRGQVAESTRSTILTIAQKLNYNVNSIARNLAQQTKDTLAILLPDITNPFFPHLVREIQTEAEAVGLTVLLCNTHNNPDMERKYLDNILSRQVEHVLCVGLTMEQQTINKYRQAGLTFVGIDRAVERRNGLVVQSANRTGAHTAVQHLLDLGHHRIGYMGGPPEFEVSQLRRDGYRDALADAGIDRHESWEATAHFSEEGGAAALRTLMKQNAGVTAIFAANDMMAIGALFAAHEAALSVPGDVSLVGFDDVPLAKYVSPKLTTVRQDIAAMAQAAVKIASLPSGQAPRHREITLPVQLVVRQSTSRLGVTEPRMRMGEMIN